ncbi:type VI secretion system protein TssA [Rodentibacter caecimuris]|uniref:Type VI secretion system ImpA domain-containing protein n=1 Tax=Rodentibacter caecimuris TaxID=1796644 RepID=A0ABX3KZJ7_9PAST|nr:type VI secretion system ImpA domain-containing protein [Rodentibacter heylii]
MEYQDILQDISGDFSPIGKPDEEGKVFFAIDEQVMKFGSLQHDSIDWDSLVVNSHQYLSHICKDYRVLQYLGYGLLYANVKLNLTVFLKLFSEFNKKYLFLAYPKPSKDQSISRFKEKSINLILERIENAINNNPEIGFTLVELHNTEQLINCIIEQLGQYIDSAESTLYRILRLIKKQADVSGNNVKQDENIRRNIQNTSNVITQEKKQSSENINIPNINTVDFDNIRQLKQFYLQVADVTCSLSPNSILGYINRRFGLWHSITQLPEMNAHGITVMQAVATDKLNDYRELVLSSPSVELLERIERTVTTSPYWIEGSYLSAKCCQFLKFDEAAEAIKNMTKQFVEKFPMFSLAKFQNGEPFLSDNTKSWLDDTESSYSSQTCNIQNQGSDFDDIYLNDGFIVTLRAIDEQLKLANDVRSRNYLQFEKIQFFLKEGMPSIAMNELLELSDNCRKYTVEEWDRTFFVRLEELKRKLLRDC